jgi:hypothetical protein
MIALKFDESGFSTTDSFTDHDGRGQADTLHRHRLGPKKKSFSICQNDRKQENQKARHP